MFRLTRRPSRVWHVMLAAGAWAVSFGCSGEDESEETTQLNEAVVEEAVADASDTVPNPALGQASILLTDEKGNRIDPADRRPGAVVQQRAASTEPITAEDLPGGGQRARLGDRFRTFSVAEHDADGNLTIREATPEELKAINEDRAAGEATESVKEN